MKGGSRAANWVIILSSRVAFQHFAESFDRLSRLHGQLAQDAQFLLEKDRLRASLQRLNPCATLSKTMRRRKADANG